MTNYAVDTHPLIWARIHNQNKRLSSKVKKIFERVDRGEDSLHISAPVIWELGAYYRARKLHTREHFFFKDWVNEVILRHPNMIFVECTLEDVLLAGDLKVNQDPFDNLIAATALRLDLPLITKDENITLAGACDVIW